MIFRHAQLVTLTKWLVVAALLLPVTGRAQEADEPTAAGQPLATLIEESNSVQAHVRYLLNESLSGIHLTDGSFNVLNADIEADPGLTPGDRAELGGQSKDIAAGDRDDASPPGNPPPDGDGDGVPDWFNGLPNMNPPPGGTGGPAPPTANPDGGVVQEDSPDPVSGIGIVAPPATLGDILGRYADPNSAPFDVPPELFRHYDNIQQYLDQGYSEAELWSMPWFVDSVNAIREIRFAMDRYQFQERAATWKERDRRLQRAREVLNAIRNGLPFSHDDPAIEDIVRFHTGLDNTWKKRILRELKEGSILRNAVVKVITDLELEQRDERDQVRIQAALDSAARNKDKGYSQIDLSEYTGEVYIYRKKGGHAELIVADPRSSTGWRMFEAWNGGSALHSRLVSQSIEISLAEIRDRVTTQDFISVRSTPERHRRLLGTIERLNESIRYQPGWFYSVLANGEMTHNCATIIRLALILSGYQLPDSTTWVDFDSWKSFGASLTGHDSPDTLFKDAGHYNDGWRTFSLTAGPLLSTQGWWKQALGYVPFSGLAQSVGHVRSFFSEDDPGKVAEDPLVSFEVYDINKRVKEIDVALPTPEDLAVPAGFEVVPDLTGMTTPGFRPVRTKTGRIPPGPVSEQIRDELASGLPIGYLRATDYVRRFIPPEENPQLEIEERFPDSWEQWLRHAEERYRQGVYVRPEVRQVLNDRMNRRLRTSFLTGNGSPDNCPAEPPAHWTVQSDETTKQDTQREVVSRENAVNLPDDPNTMAGALRGVFFGDRAVSETPPGPFPFNRFDEFNTVLPSPVDDFFSISALPTIAGSVAAPNPEAPDDFKFPFQNVHAELPVAGDFDGSGLDDIGTYEGPEHWFLPETSYSGEDTLDIRRDGEKYKILKGQGLPPWVLSAGRNERFAENNDQWALGKIGLSRRLHEQVAEAAAGAVTVAVIDSGVDLNHPELWGQLWRNTDEIPFNGIDDDRNGYVDDVYGFNTQANNASIRDDNGHGTAVAGIIAARWDQRGMAGIAPKSRLMIIKAFDAQGKSDSARVALGVRYAVANGANIVHISAETNQPHELDQAVVSWAREQGVLVIAASGSQGLDTAGVSPAGLSGVLTVGAVDRNDKRAHFSGWGNEVDVVAPGVEILSLRASGTDFMHAMSGAAPGFPPGERVVAQHWYRADGTSFAAPIVTGVAAALWAQNPQLTAQQVRNRILMSCDDLGRPGWDRESGMGRLNARSAFASQQNQHLETRIYSATIAKTNNGPVLRINGIAAGPHAVKCEIQLAPGNEPDDEDWETVIATEGNRTGSLADIPGKRFTRAGVWSLRSIVTGSDGTSREARTTVRIR